MAGKMQKEQRKTSCSVMMETTTTVTEEVSEEKSPVTSKRQTKEEEVSHGKNIWYFGTLHIRNMAIGYTVETVYIQSVRSTLSQCFVMFFHSSCESLPGQ